MSDKSKLPTDIVRERTGGMRQHKLNVASEYTFGKIQPQAPHLEQVVLGAIMINKDALPIVLDIISAESFYSDRHKLIYKAMVRLFDKSEPIDLLTVSEELRKSGDLEVIGNSHYLIDLTNRVASSANIEYHARIIAEKYMQRAIIKNSTDILSKAYDDTADVFDLLDEAEQGLFEITQNNLSRGPEGMGSITSKLMDQLISLKGKEDGLTGVPTGFAAFDRLTSGLQPSDLFILAARPGMGKTSFVLALARNAAVDFGKPVAIFSLEMSNVQLVQRLVSLEAEIEGMKLRKVNLEEYEWQQVNTAVEKLSNSKIFIDDTPGINIFELRAKARRLKMQHDIQMVIIDYLQLMSGGGDNKKGNREQEVSAISRALKGLAKELNVPVIALSQLSRAVETRGGAKRPMLSDLRESGSIEQDADMVGFIYRPDYYGILEDEDGTSLKGIAELIIAKNRHGSAETLKMRFVHEFAKFADLEDPNFNDLSLDTFESPVDSGNIMTVASKMNDANFVPPSTDDEIPF